MEHQQYEISSQTIKDIVDNVPMDKWEHVAQDLYDMLKQTKAIATVIQVTAEHLTGDDGVKMSDLVGFDETITWVDDGKHENEFNFVDEAGQKVENIKFGGE